MTCANYEKWIYIYSWQKLSKILNSCLVQVIDLIFFIIFSLNKQHFLLNDNKILFIFASYFAFEKWNLCLNLYFFFFFGPQHILTAFIFFQYMCEHTYMHTTNIYKGSPQKIYLLCGDYWHTNKINGKNKEILMFIDIKKQLKLLN